jgi:hypothetical protein
MAMYREAPLSIGLAAALAACSGGGGKSTASPVQASGGDDGGASATPSAVGANPDGIAYPSAATGYGRSPRSGSTPGSIIRNFKFSGYPNSVTSTQLQTIALGDYYDPCSKRSKLIHLTVGALWCPPCNQETDAIVAAKQQLDSDGVVVLQALNDGNTQNVGATPADMSFWIKKHHTTFTEMLDPDPNPVLGEFFNAAAVPWNCDIDPRTMEILDAATGWGGDIATDLAPALTEVQGPPGYPLPAACNDM